MLLLQILQYTPAQQKLRILSFSVCVLVAYLTGIDERRNYKFEIPPREIQWPNLIGLHYDEFRATASEMFSLDKKKCSLLWLNLRKLLYLTTEVVQMIKEISIC